jgi:RiboL-PSP-HEPN
VAGRSGIDDIVETKTRGYGPIADAAPVLLRVRLMSFVEECKELVGTQKSFYSPDYILIHLVTLLEAFLKSSLAYLIDSGEPYRTNARGLLASWSTSSKQIADAILAIHQDRVSLGEIISFIPSYSRVENIINTFETVFGADFKDCLADTRKYWIQDAEGDITETPCIIENLNETIAAIDKLLRVRHILVHEVPRHSPYDKEDLLKFADHVLAIVDAVDCAITTKMHGRPPRSGKKVLEEALSDLEAAKSELALLTASIQSIENQSLSDQKVEEAFLTFCGAAAAKHARCDEEFQSADSALSYATEFQRLVRWRIDDLGRRKVRFEAVTLGSAKSRNSGTTT